MSALLHYDAALFLFLNHFLSNPVCDAVFMSITNGRFWIIPGVCAAMLFMYFRKKEAIVVIGLALLTVSVSDPVCNRIIKPLVPRQRPCNMNVHIDGARFLIGRKDSPSFPSSHAMNMFAQATLFSLLYRKKRVWIIAYLFAATIGFSRIYVGVHYPLDVFCGALFGIAVGAGIYFLFRFLRKKFFQQSPLAFSQISGSGTERASNHLQLRLGVDDIAIDKQ